VKVAEKAIDRLKAQVRILSRRTRGHSLLRIIRELRESLLGWKAYFDLAEVLSPLYGIWASGCDVDCDVTSGSNGAVPVPVSCASVA